MREAFRQETPRAGRGPAAFLHEVLGDRDATRPLVVTLPAPVAHDVVALWDESTDAVLFAPPASQGGVPLAGLGVAVAIDASGNSRFARAESEARRVFADVVTVGHPSLEGEQPEPRFVGGLAFAPGSAAGVPWANGGIAPFGDARFVLPRWTYRIDGNAATLQLCLAAGASARGVIEQHERIVARLQYARPAEERITLRGVIEEPPERYLERVERITRRIADGEAQKIVAARRVEARLEHPASPRPLAERFARRQPESTRFAMRVAGSTFLGATPERLVAITDGRVQTTALAGTAPRGDREALQSSLKDAEEHALVVDAIAAALEPFVVEVEKPDEPRVQVLTDVLHLETPIAGTLARPAHLLEVAAALHPTPAVGGVPQEAAIAHILAHEPPRGWYAAPFGTFDRHGEGELVVAIRSGVLRGDRAWAWAGGGIVRDSDPEAELAEARLKLRSFLGVLDG